MATEPPHETEEKSFLPLSEPRDSAAWREVVMRHGPRLRVRMEHALRRAGWTIRPDRLDDLLQEVYCRLLSAGARRLGAFRGDHPFQLDAYLGRMAERVAIDEVRALRTLKRNVGRLSRLGEMDVSYLEAITDPGGTPLDHLLARERWRRFLGACCRTAGRQTPRRDVQIARLALVEGWTSREISRVLEGRLAASSVDSVVHRMKRKLAAEGIVLPPRPRSPRRGRRARGRERGRERGRGRERRQCLRRQPGARRRAGVRI